MKGLTTEATRRMPLAPRREWAFNTPARIRCSDGTIRLIEPGHKNTHKESTGNENKEHFNDCSIRDLNSDHKASPIHSSLDPEEDASNYEDDFDSVSSSDESNAGIQDGQVQDDIYVEDFEEFDILCAKEEEAEEILAKKAAEGIEHTEEIQDLSDELQTLHLRIQALPKSRQKLLLGVLQFLEK